MVEIMPSTSETGSSDPESFIRFLMQGDAAQGAVSNELLDYENILNEYESHSISAEQAIEKAKQISAGRQTNYH